MNHYFVWDVDPLIVQFGGIQIRWYGVLFALGIAFGFFMLEKVFAREKKQVEDVGTILTYMVFSILIGARLGHCLFYDFNYYIRHPLEILMIWRGGLASHGAFIGIITGLWIYTKRHSEETTLWLYDRIVLVAALPSALVRLGNLMNHEIVGKPTDLPWAFVFRRVDVLPRHPAQLYESVWYLITFIVLSWLYYKKDAGRRDGLLFGVFILMIFVFRFSVEFVKREQVAFERGTILNMGQALSIPFICVGLFFVIRALKNKPQNPSFRS